MILFPLPAEAAPLLMALAPAFTTPTAQRFQFLLVAAILTTGRRTVANSPLMSWVYGPMSVRSFSAVLGVVEVVIAILVAVRPFSPRTSALGSVLAVGMFLTTLSFLVTTPGVWEPSAGAFPALTALPGQFLIKDLALLGISLWTLGDAWKASARRE